MYELIASAFLGNYILVRPGCRNGMKISYARYEELAQAVPDNISPAWLVAVARRAWDLDISDEPVSGRILVRPESSLGYGRASYEQLRLRALLPGVEEI
ncbi:MAG: hypothetical protein ACRDRU_04625 [Pseudonocardiaceae bacterium]